MPRTPDEQNAINEEGIAKKQRSIKVNGVATRKGGRCVHFDNVSGYCGLIQSDVKCDARANSDKCLAEMRAYCKLFDLGKKL